MNLSQAYWNVIVIAAPPARTSPTAFRTTYENPYGYDSQLATYRNSEILARKLLKMSKTFTASPLSTRLEIMVSGKRTTVLAGIRRDTIMRQGVRVGEACAKIQDEKMRGLNCSDIEVDELWDFIGAKRKNANRAGVCGDVRPSTALDCDSKLIPSFIVGKCDSYHAKTFMSDVAARLKDRVQLSSDSLAAYVDAVDYGFGSLADYGQIVKTYAVSNLNKDAASRYSSAKVVRIEKTIVQGMPEVSRISPPHVEKQNHTLRCTAGA